MRAYSLVFATIVAFGFSASGCGPDSTTPGDCSPTTCGGCCQNGQCILQINELACGLNGATCQTCPIGQLCDMTTGICGQSTSECGPASCSDGCCYNGQCVRPGNYPYACGMGGQQCQQCTGSQQCSNGQCITGTGACSPANCSSCCVGDNCVTPATNTQCGAGGAPCVPCPTGYNCDLQVGQCVQGNDCSTCTTGCCLNNICYPGTSPAACGANGTTCDSCEPDQICSGGRCQTATTECNISNCWAGCCTTSGCVLNGSYNDNACGVAATACDTCTAYETCQAGSCMNEATQCQSTCENGCCYGGDCKPYAYQDNSSCGTSGNTCAPCPGGTNCDRQSGLCTAPTYCTNCTQETYCCDGSTCRPGNSQGYCGSKGGACERCATLTTPCIFNSSIQRYVCQTSAQTCPGCTGLTQCCSSGVCQTSGTNGYCGSNGLPCSTCTQDKCQLLDGRYQCVQTATNWRVCLEAVTINCAALAACNDTSDTDPQITIKIGEAYISWTQPEASFGYTPGQLVTHSFGTSLCLDGVSDGEVRNGLWFWAWEDDPYIDDWISSNTACQLVPTSAEMSTGLMSRGCQSNVTYTVRFFPQ